MPPKAVRSIDVEVIATPDDVLLTYLVAGRDALALPEGTSPRRADKLWEHTCFELFLMPFGDERYFEFNFSPSTEWAAYQFDKYRAGMAALPLALEPQIDFVDDQDRYGLEIDVAFEDLPRGALKMGLSAVIEERDGTKSYWALAHPSAKPDFHHRDCFVIDFPAPASA